MTNKFKDGNLLLAVARALPDPIFIIDAEGTYLHVMGGSERTLYDSGRHLVGKRMHDVLPASKADYFLKIVREAIEKKQIQVHEYPLAPTDFANNPGDGPEGEQWFQARVYPLELEEGTLPAVVLLVINITDRKRTEEELRRLSSTDPLTGAHNRRSFLNALEHELHQVERYQVPAAVMLLDLDGFKAVNDTWGHACGDSTIINVVRVMESHLRKSDILGRFGGDEFAILLCNTTLEQALYVAEKLRLEVERAAIVCEGHEVGVTASIGVAAITAADASINHLLARADVALYEAKHRGRNTVVAG